MDIEKKIELNKRIRKYDGENQFILDLKKSLASSWAKKELINGRTLKVLSDKQYEAAITTLNL